MVFRRLACSSFAALAALFAAAMTPACAGQPTAAGSAAKEPTSSADRAASSADEAPPEGADAALAVLDRAEADLAAAIGPAPQPGRAQRAFSTPPGESKKEAQGAPPPPPGQPSPSSPAAPAQAQVDPPAPKAAAPARGATKPSATVSATDDEERQGPPPCERACRALASMQRAMDHLCGLAGEADARCSGARERVRSAGERVHAACPACAGDGGG